MGIFFYDRILYPCVINRGDIIDLYPKPTKIYWSTTNTIYSSNVLCFSFRLCISIVFRCWMLIILSVLQLNIYVNQRLSCLLQLYISNGLRSYTITHQTIHIRSFVTEKIFFRQFKLTIDFYKLLIGNHKIFSNFVNFWCIKLSTEGNFNWTLKANLDLTAEHHWFH